MYKTQMHKFVSLTYFENESNVLIWKCFYRNIHCFLCHVLHRVNFTQLLKEPKVKSP